MKFNIADRLFVRPPILHFEVENRCNMSCPMCITKSHRLSDFAPLTLQEIKSMVLAQFKLAGGSHLNLTGGEPLLSEDLEEIIEYAIRIKLHIILNTNLYQINPHKIRNILGMMKDSRYKLVVSYDSVDPEEFKAVRGVDACREVTGNLERLFQIRKDAGANTNFIVNLTLQEQNCRSIADTLHYLTRFDFNKIFVVPVNIYGEINASNFHQVKPPCSREALPDLLEAVDTIFSMAGKDRRIGVTRGDIARWRRHFEAPTTQQHICQSDKFLFVSRHGDYRGCHQSKVYANIREIGMVDFLKSQAYLEHKKLLGKCNICTHECA